MRTLVATAVAIAAGETDGQLLETCTSGQQELTAHEAPALGLCFCEAGAEDDLAYEWRWGA